MISLALFEISRLGGREKFHQAKSAKQNRLWPYYLFDILSGIHFSSAIIIPFFISWGHLSYTQIYSLQSWFLILILIFEIPTGIFADRFGKKLSLRLGAITGSLGLLSIGFFSHIAIFFLAELFTALSVALISGAFEAILYESLAKKRTTSGIKKAFGKSYAMKMIGALLVVPMGAFLAARIGINIPILIDGFVLLAAFFVVSFMQEPKNKTDCIDKSQIDIAKQGIYFFRHHSQVRFVTLGMITLGLSGYYAMWLYQPMLIQMKTTLEYYGWFSALFIGSQIIIALNFSLIDKLISIRSYILISITAMILVFLLVAISLSLSSILLLIIVGAHANAQLRYVSAHINQWIPSAQRATTLSAISMLQSLSITLINPIIGFSMDHNLKFGILIVASFVTLLLLCINFLNTTNNCTLTLRQDRD